MIVHFSQGSTLMQIQTSKLPPRPLMWPSSSLTKRSDDDNIIDGGGGGGDGGGGDDDDDDNEIVDNNYDVMSENLSFD